MARWGDDALRDLLTPEELETALRLEARTSEVAPPLGGVLDDDEAWELELEETRRELDELGRMLEVAMADAERQQEEDAAAAGAVPTGPEPMGAADFAERLRLFRPTLPLAARRKPPAPPPFPTEVLPDDLRRLVAEGAAAAGIPADYVGVPLLALLAAAIGNRVALQVRPGWVERAILWTVAVGEPGGGKSPGLGLARIGIDALQAEAHRRHEAALAEWEEAGGTGRAPAVEHVWTSDATFEAVVLMAAGGRGFAVVRDELAGWAASMDQYRQGGDRQGWLSMWAGAPVKCDRKSTGTVWAPRPCVSLTGGVQPDALGTLWGNARHRDGLPDRFLAAYPPPSGPRRWHSRALDPQVLVAAEATFRLLRREDAPEVVCVLAPGAEARFAAAFEQAEQDRCAASGIEQGWLAKAGSHLARLALVLHAAHHPDATPEAVPEARVAGAVALFDYFRAHLGRVLDVVGAVRTPFEYTVWQRVCAAGPAGATRTDLHRTLGGHVAAADLSAALQTLETMGHVETLPSPRSAVPGRPPERWRGRGLGAPGPGPAESSPDPW